MGASVIVVRGQEPEDIAGLTELLNQPRAIWGTLQLPHTSVAARRARSEGPSPGRPATRLVALIDGKVVGSLGLDRFEGRRAHVGAFGMAVHDDFAGLGVGTALMQAMIDQADRWLGLIRLELTVWADNVRAIALYERFGFEREGLMRAYAFRDGAYVDSLAMARVRLPIHGAALADHDQTKGASIPVRRA
jgi:putative acetyltransferase